MLDHSGSKPFVYCVSYCKMEILVTNQPKLFYCMALLYTTVYIAVVLHVLCTQLKVNI